MRAWVASAFVVCILLLAPGGGSGQSRPDHYANTEFGPVTFFFDGDQLTGNYPKFSGNLYLRRVGGASYSGNWVQPRSDRRCSQPFNGSYHWGRVNMRFSGSNNFQGEWGYCSDNPSSTWNGRRN